MLFKLLVLFIVVPLVELTLLLMLAQRTNALFALLVVIVTGVAGSLLARSQGWKTLRRIQVEMNAGKLPTDALADAAIIFCAGVLLLTPGMLTDAFGLSLLIPFSRRWYRNRLLTWIRRNFKVAAFESTVAGNHSQIIDSYVVDPPSIVDQPPKQSE